ncbi:transcription factor Adf-1-like [Centruroides vittatus]|uniref:transcription factor Adf-1-like n=1 Tax=Centruroides vittatus TaxID=120091 RepID=UPI00350F361F
MATQTSSRSRVDVEKLLEEMEAAPFLYIKMDRRYKDIQLKENRWKLIAENLNLTVEEVKKKWKNLVDTYRKEKKIIDEKTRSGAGVDDLHNCNWKWFSQMHLLMNIFDGQDVQFSQTSSNLLLNDGIQSEDVEEMCPVQMSYPGSPNFQSLSMDISKDVPCTSSSSTEQSLPPKRRKKNKEDDVHTLIQLTEAMVNKQQKEDELYHYSVSLADRLRNLSPQKRAEARFKIEEVMYNITKEHS